MENKSEFGNNIRNLRKSRGWSQQDIGAKMGLSTAAFSKIESGQTDVSISRLQQIATLMEVPLAQVILPSSEDFATYSQELNASRKTIESQLSKIVDLQEYIIELYEQLQQARFELTNLRENQADEKKQQP